MLPSYICVNLSCFWCFKTGHKGLTYVNVPFLYSDYLTSTTLIEQTLTSCYLTSRRRSPKLYNDNNNHYWYYWQNLTITQVFKLSNKVTKQYIKATFDKRGFEGHRPNLQLMTEGGQRCSNPTGGSFERPQSCPNGNLNSGDLNTNKHLRRPFGR